MLFDLRRAPFALSTITRSTIALSAIALVVACSGSAADGPGSADVDPGADATDGAASDGTSPGDDGSRDGGDETLDTVDSGTTGDTGAAGDTLDTVDGGDAISAGDAPTNGRGVRVVGVRLERDGQPWNPKGLSMIGALTRGQAVAARAHFGAAEIAAAKAFGADTFRFQVSQPALDPSDPAHDPAYLAEVESIVTRSLDAGFVVVLSMQDQSLAGGNATPTPTASTVRAWKVLAPVYAKDPRVIYELYNEPQTKADPAGWSVWTSGDATGAVGHQALVDQLRAAGAINVLFADGAQLAEILPSTPLLRDPLARVVYAAHPYYLGPAGREVAQWDARFGQLSAIAPVVVSEWNNDSGNSCNINAPTLVPQLLSYLKSHHIGIYGWAFDFPGTLIQDWSWTPTNYAGYVCGSAGHGGAGELSSASFKGP